MFSNKSKSYNISRDDRQCFNSPSSKYLRASTTFLNHFFKVPSSFGEDDPEAVKPPPTKTPVITSAINELVLDRAIRIDCIEIPCSWSKVQIHSAKDLFS